MKRLAVLLLLGAAPAPQVASDLLQAETPAPTLAAYGLFTDTAGRTPAPGVRPYTLNTPLFSDYAEKFRYVWMPPGTAARYTPTGVLDFPIGTTLVKTFAYPADFRAPANDVRLIETRLLVRRASGWVPLSYVWNAAQTEAVLKRAGTRVPVTFIDTNGQSRAVDYAVPNTNQCKQCHQQGSEATPIGPTAANLNGPLNGQGENQLASWTASGHLTGLPANAPRLARWDNPSEPVAARARAYLDVNCGHCHSRAGFASNSGLYLQHDETSPAHQGILKRPVAAGRGSGGRQFSIVPGDPDSSILLHRMEASEPGVMMPQFGRTLAHAEGIALIRQYIAGMPPTPG
nr:SO2930 family diheme c-type cytochrome [Polymorphobacter sp.]